MSYLEKKGPVSKARGRSARRAAKAASGGGGEKTKRHGRPHTRGGGSRRDHAPRTHTHTRPVSESSAVPRRVRAETLLPNGILLAKLGTETTECRESSALSGCRVNTPTRWGHSLPAKDSGQEFALWL